MTYALIKHNHGDCDGCREVTKQIAKLREDLKEKLIDADVGLWVWRYKPQDYRDIVRLLAEARNSE